jgi:DNA sulfur modification protein DndB
MSQTALNDGGGADELPRINPKSVVAAISPLLIDQDALRKTYRLKRSAYVQKKVHIADLDEALTGGWVLQKKGKRTATVQKKKPISQALEDRFWCLCHNMGYAVLNGTSLRVSYQRENGTSGFKQIDVFAKDDETVAVVECKTKEARGRKSLQKDIHETAHLQKPIADAIRKHFGGFKPKIIWLYVTENIIWSENDVERAHASNIRIINENQLQYFEAYIDHVGTAGRYQFLAEFLQGQDIPGLTGVKVPATRGRLGKDTFYSFTIPAGILLKVAFVNHHALNNPDGRPAYQRMIEKKRLASIGRYIQDGGYFPTNILVNFVQKCQFEPIAKDDQDTDAGLRFGHLIFPNQFKSAWIIDGQHRLFGFTNLPPEFLNVPLFVVAFEQMDTAKEAELFITINHKQKSVPPSLLAALQADLLMGSDDPEEAISALASFLIRKLSADATSPLFGRFQIPGVPATDAQTLTIPELQKGLKRSQLLGRIVRKVRLEGYLSGNDDDATLERARKVINGYFKSVEEASGSRWSSGRSGHILTNPGIRAHIMMIAEVLRYLHGMGKLDPYVASVDQLVGAIADFCRPMLRWLSQSSPSDLEQRFARRYGEGGVKEYLYHLCDLLSASHPDFGSDEYRAYKAHSEDERNAQAKLDVEDITKLISTVVIETLKRTYGTDELPSGEKKYWELGIADSEIKKAAYKAQQETKAEKRAPREAYLHLLDFEKIIKQKGNWELFKPIFNIPLRNDPNPKNKEYHLAWLADFNEVRKVTSHSSIYRSLSPEDHDFLAWIKQVLYERCSAAGFNPE